MKVTDEPRWRAQQAELSATDDGRIFLAFLEEWVSRAERGLKTVTRMTSPLSPLEILRFNFELTEEKLGQIPGSWLGMLLLVIGTFWEHGADALNDMTVFEQRIVLDAKARMIHELQEQAAEIPTCLPDYLETVPTE